ncbi:MAG: hypothetical protein H6625_10425 [Bdellovibrionaceae bacterium]|nr:hypothetical protein [Pseudobdellovibrionaceae bacterium]
MQIGKNRGCRLKKLVLLLLLTVTTECVAKGENLLFMQEERLGSSIIYNGWNEIKNLIYRPNFVEIQNMFQLTQNSKNFGSLNFVLRIDELRLQYVLFNGDLFGIIMEGKIDRQGDLSTCFIYSRVDFSQMNWSLNNYKCEE